MSENLSYWSQCFEMIEWTFSTTETLREFSIKWTLSTTKALQKMFSIKTVKNSCWKTDVLIAEERISFFSEKIAKKTLQEKQKYSLSSHI